MGYSCTPSSATNLQEPNEITYTVPYDITKKFYSPDGVITTSKLIPDSSLEGMIKMNLQPNKINND